MSKLSTLQGRKFIRIRQLKHLLTTRVEYAGTSLDCAGRRLNMSRHICITRVTALVNQILPRVCGHDNLQPVLNLGQMSLRKIALNRRRTQRA